MQKLHIKRRMKIDPTHDLSEPSRRGAGSGDSSLSEDDRGVKSAHVCDGWTRPEVLDTMPMSIVQQARITANTDRQAGMERCPESSRKNNECL